jgi:hypothetical protein
MPASKTPSRKRTPAAWEKLSTKAVTSEAMPKPREMAGMNQPGPIHLHAMLDGISKMMYET